MNLRIMTLAWMLLAAGTTWAGEADVEAVEAVPMGENRYRFQITVRHADEGWDHYADRIDAPYVSVWEKGRCQEVKMVYINPAIEKITGFSARKVLKIGFSIFVPPETPQSRAGFRAR
ncbi:MAG: hypothetical protein JJV98_05965 [Desulfosarcina sp.]|nr:hypothetical protein [Desulfobacterales bacterium]